MTLEPLVTLGSSHRSRADRPGNGEASQRCVENGEEFRVG